VFESRPPGDERQPIPPPDPGVLQVLANEHWSLLATRSLTYSESLSRVSMFLSVLSGAVIALALVAQADHFGQTFVLVAILILTVVLFVGVTTVIRLDVLNQDDIRWVKGMNRIRHGYLDLHPEAEPYFVTTHHDDFRGVAVTMGFELTPIRGFGQIAHGVQTLPGVVSVLVSVVAGALGSLVARAFDAPTGVIVAAAIAGFLLTGALIGAWGARNFLKFHAAHTSRFPSEEPAKQQ
jgi:hypothetical protein